MMKAFRTWQMVGMAVIAALLLSLVPVLPQAEAAGGVITYGQTVSGQISNQNYFELWQFEGQQGDRVRINMTGSGGLDSYVGLIELATEQVLMEDDDTGGNGNALLETTLPTSGSFVIVATRYDFERGTTQGEYSLALEGGSGPQANATGDSAGQGQEVDPGVFYMGDLTLGTPAVGLISATSYAHLYTIQLQQGDDVMVAMLADASNLDPYLIFGLEDGTVLAEDDDSGAQGGGRYDAYVRLTAPQTGSYIVVATRAGLDTGQSAGDYRLIAAYAEETPATGDNSDLPAGVEALGAIATGAPMTGAISSTSYAHLYTLNGSAGETVTITMAGAGGLDAYLGLLDPENQVIAEDDDSGGGATGYDAQISIRLPESGSYVIVATRAGIDEGTSTGSYTLTVTSGAPPAPTGVTGTSGVGGFGGLPGRAFQAGDTTFYLRGFGATDNPDKATPLQGLLLPEQPLPGRSITTDGQKFYLTGFGATDDPAKATPLQAFLNQ